MKNQKQNQIIIYIEFTEFFDLINLRKGTYDVLANRNEFQHPNQNYIVVRR